MAYWAQRLQEQQNTLYDKSLTQTQAQLVKHYQRAAKATVDDIKVGIVNDYLGKDTYNDMLDNTVGITGKTHNVLTLEENGVRIIRGKLNEHSAKLLAGQNTLGICAENSIAIHKPFDPEIDKKPYSCKIAVFC